MKFLIFIFFNLIATSALAEGFEIPVGQDDPSIVLEPASFESNRIRGYFNSSHNLYRKKKIEIDGKAYAVVYNEVWGWSSSSEFVSICKWENSTTIGTCLKDRDCETMKAFNNIVDTYSMQRKKVKLCPNTTRKQTETSTNELAQ